MQVDFESISQNLFSTEMSKIPEPYRSEFLEIVENAQNNLKIARYPGEAGAGLVKVTVNNTGALTKVDIDKSLVQRRTDNDVEYKEFNELISNLLITAHAQALKKAQDALDDELKKLHNEILKLSNKILSNKGN